MAEPGYVYIVHGIGTSYIKVGKTTDIERRLQDLSHGVPFRLRVLFVELVHDMDTTERAMKARYQGFQSRGEWFELSAEVLALWPEVTEKVRPLKTHEPSVRLVPKKPGMTERILTLLEQRGAMNARRMQQYLTAKSEAINAVLPQMIEAGTVQAHRKGKTTIYTLAHTDTDEQELA